MYKIFLLFIFLCAGTAVRAEVFYSDSTEIEKWTWATELALQENQSGQLRQQQASLKAFEAAIAQGCQPSSEEWQDYWRARIGYEQFLQSEEIRLLGIRYERGIELIRLLYEKILSLDHHFSGMRTYQNVMVLSNPHQYPGFEQAKSRMEASMKRKNPIQIPNLLHSNPFFSATFSLVSTILGEGETKQKQAEFEQLSCILDFTVRMNAELSMIQHETTYLQGANQQLRTACEALFEDYVKIIGYHVSLEKCRQQDDWEQVRMDLGNYLSGLEGMETIPTDYRRALINLEFATQRVAEFINVYQNSIVQGTQYYQKFDRILNGYENEEHCDGQLPMQFEELKYDVKSTIEKFRNTYQLPEIQGSRMKQLLYGHLGS